MLGCMCFGFLQLGVHRRFVYGNLCVTLGLRLCVVASRVLQNVATAAGYGMPNIDKYLVGIAVACGIGMICLPSLPNVFVLGSCIFGVYLTSWLAKYALLAIGRCVYVSLYEWSD